MKGNGMARKWSQLVSWTRLQWKKLADADAPMRRRRTRPTAKSGKTSANRQKKSRRSG